LSADWEGLLLVDKPEGPTSHDIVALVRRATGQRRVGHAGTLDPMASGLLPLVLGRATRLVRFLPHSPKEYRGTLRLGLTSDSDDITGEITERHEGPLPEEAAVVQAASEFVGRGLQVPPNVSARKVQGQRLYKLARSGVKVNAAATEVEIEQFALKAEDSAGLYSFVAVVSGGTYIRSLARDLGAKLGSGGVLASLRRTAIGPMKPDPGLDFEPQALREALIPLERMPLALPALQLASAEEAGRFSSGMLVAPGPEAVSTGFCAVLSPGGLLLGVAEMREGALQPRVVLPPEA
jgi:tRNA pseudouridine55 synthase